MAKPEVAVWVIRAEGKDGRTWPRDREGKDLERRHTMTRVPNVGEFIMLEGFAPWVKVLLVIHCPKGDHDAEIYVTQVDHSEEVDRVWQDGKL